jgi:hypothetical protein
VEAGPIPASSSDFAINTPHIARREAIVPAGQDAEIDESNDVPRLDAGSLSRLLA